VILGIVIFHFGENVIYKIKILGEIVGIFLGLMVRINPKNWAFTMAPV
jgi:hypothetical protein